MAVAPPRPAAGRLPGPVPGTRRSRAGHVRGTRHRRVPGRCCAATAMPGSPPPRNARPATAGRGSRGGAGSLMPVRWYHGTFTLDPDQHRLRIPTARGWPPLWLRLARPVPYPPEQVRSVTLLFEDGRLWLDVTAEVPVAVYPPGQEPDPARVAGVDLGSHPPLRRRRTRRVGAAGVRAGDPRRTPHAPGRHQSPPPGRRPPGTEARAAGVAAVAADPPPADRRWKAATSAGSAKPCTRPPRPWSAEPSPAGSGPYRRRPPRRAGPGGGASA